MSAGYNKLFFDSLNFNETEGVNPHFICPSCKTEFAPKYKPVAKFPTTFDFNQQVVFQCPNCGIQIKLYVAIHKDGDSISVCIQRSDAEGAGGIPTNWWVRSEL